MGNPGPGGWAAILRCGTRERELSGGKPATTNNRMELRAALAGLSSLDEACEVTIHTDSQYLRKGMTEWIHGWKARGWITSARQPVKNADLWRELDSRTKLHRVSWKWLKGHAGHPENERCDALAAAEIEKIQSTHSREQLAACLQVFQSPTATKPEQSFLDFF